MRNSNCKRWKKKRAVTALTWTSTATSTSKLKEYVKLHLSYCSTTAVLLQLIYALQCLFTLLHSTYLYLPWPIFTLRVSSLSYSPNFFNSPWFPISAISMSESWYSRCPFNLISIVCTGMPSKWGEKGLYILINRSDRIEARGGQLIRFAHNISQCWHFTTTLRSCTCRKPERIKYVCICENHKGGI